MKLTYLAQSKIPSTEANSVHVMKMCHALACTGNQIKLIVPDIESDVSNPFAFYGVKDNFTIIHKKWKKVKLGNFLYSIKVLLSLLKDRDQVVYGRDMVSCFFASLFGFKTIWESHTPVDYMGKLYVILFKIMISQKHYLKTVVISSTLKDYYMQNYGLKSSTIEILPDCADKIDIDKVAPIKLDDNKYKTNVGYIGQLYPGKGMEIISKLVPLCPDVMFHIIGGNDKDVKYWRNQMQICHNIKFYGFVKPVETISYGIAMDILVAPYLKTVHSAGSNNPKKNLAQWMSPLKIFDYMSYKKPIITSNLPVLYDVLNDDNSIMCSPDNINEWEVAIHKLVEDKEEANRIAENAYSDFINKYTWNIRADKIIEFYKNA